MKKKTAFISAKGDAAYCCVCLGNAKRKAEKKGRPFEDFINPLPHPPILIPTAPTYSLIDPPEGYKGPHKKLGFWKWNHKGFCVRHAIYYLRKRGSKDMTPKEKS